MAVARVSGTPHRPRVSLPRNQAVGAKGKSGVNLDATTINNNNDDDNSPLQTSAWICLTFPALMPRVHHCVLIIVISMEVNGDDGFIHGPEME